MYDKSRHDGYNASNLGKAKRLRREMTSQEKHLWYDFLKTYPVHFYRQRPITHYIVDFYSTPAKLVIELDGDQHAEPAVLEYDRKRTEDLEALGLAVLRLTNEDVDRSFDSVCHKINEEVKARLRCLGNTEMLEGLEASEKTWDAYEE